MDTNSKNPDKQVLDEEFPDLALINSDENNLMSETYEEILDALDIFYIKGNLSGRLRFHEAWPVMGQYILGDELIDFDQNGASDFERRTVLEQEAEERRLQMIEHISVLPVKSVEKGIMQVEYVEKVVKEFGRDLALEIYSSKVVDRFIPPEPVTEEDSDEKAAGHDEEGLAENQEKSTTADPVPQAGAEHRDFSTEGMSVPQDNLSSVSSLSVNDAQVDEQRDQQRAERAEKPVAAMIAGADPLAPVKADESPADVSISVDEEETMDDIRPVEASVPSSPSPSTSAEPPEEAKPEPKVEVAPDLPPSLPEDPFLDFEEDPLDAIQPISVGASPVPSPAPAPIDSADNQVDIPQEAPALEIDEGHQKSEPEPHQPNQWETPAAASLEIEEPYERQAQPNQWANPAQLAPENRIEEPVSPVEPLGTVSPVAAPTDPVASVEPPASAYDEPERPAAPPTPPKPADDGANEFQPNQWSNPEPQAPAVSEEVPAETIQNDAMQGFKVSQKMTFVPSPKEEDEGEAASKSPVIPVIGSSSKADDQDGDGE